MKRNLQFITGSYASAAEEAIGWFELDDDRGVIRRSGGTSGIEKPSFVVSDAPRSRLFAVSETQQGEVVSYAMDRVEQALREMNRQPTHGAYPCHLTVDASGCWLTLVNYGSGSVCLYPIEVESGAIGPVSERIQHLGSSVHPQRQEAPHPHAIYPDPAAPGDYLVPDLGTDTIYTYRLDARAGRLLPIGETRVKAGAGPRHAAFSPDGGMVYVIHELDNAIDVYQRGERAGELVLRQTVATLPPGFKGVSTCAEIEVSPSGHYVYGSNRGHDSIAAYRVGSDGLLTLQAHIPSGGRTPRSFALSPDGRWLLAANQDSDTIESMRVGTDGIPVISGERFPTSSPVCITFLR